MSTAAPAPAAQATSGEHRPASGSPNVLMGFLMVAAVPAVFWTGMAALGGHLLGFTLSPLSLAVMALVLALFLMAVFAAIVVAR